MPRHSIRNIRVNPRNVKANGLMKKNHRASMKNGNPPVRKVHCGDQMRVRERLPTTLDQQYIKPPDAKSAPHQIDERSSACGGLRYIAIVQINADAEASAPRSAIPTLTAGFDMSARRSIRGKLHRYKSGHGAMVQALVEALVHLQVQARIRSPIRRPARR